jgi:hypothetical protein
VRVGIAARRNGSQGSRECDIARQGCLAAETKIKREDRAQAPLVDGGLELKREAKTETLGRRRQRRQVRTEESRRGAKCEPSAGKGGL